MTVTEIIAKAQTGALSNEECSTLSKAIEQGRVELEGVRNKLNSALHNEELAKSELASMVRRDGVKALAQKYSFTDHEYLDFLLNKKELNLEDSESIDSFMTQLSSENPKFFELEISGGSGSGVDNLIFTPKSSSAVGAGRINSTGDIASMLDSAPEFL